MISRKEDIVPKEELARQLVDKNDNTKDYSEAQVLETVKHMKPFHQDVSHTANKSEILIENIDI